MRPLSSSLEGFEEPVQRYFAHALAADDAGPADRFDLSMSGRIKLGPWLPFTADQELGRDAFVWRARVGAGALTLFRAVDQYSAGRGAMDVRLFGRLGVVHADDSDVVRSAAGRVALEKRRPSRRRRCWARRTSAGEPSPATTSSPPGALAPSSRRSTSGSAMRAR